MKDTRSLLRKIFLSIILGTIADLLIGDSVRTIGGQAFGLADTALAA